MTISPLQPTDVRSVPWDREKHITHAIVSGTDGQSDWRVYKTARSEQEAELYLSNYREFGPHALLPSEVSKYLKLIYPYLDKPCLDLGSGGYPVTDFAIQYEQPSEDFNRYTGGRKPDMPIHIHGDILNLPFKDGTVGTIVASHLIEDWSREKWIEFFREWHRALRPGGKLVVLIPDATRWQYCLQVLGQCPNCSHHSPEPEVGDFTRTATAAGFNVIEDRLADCFKYDYTILGVAVKG